MKLRVLLAACVLWASILVAQQPAADGLAEVATTAEAAATSQPLPSEEIQQYRRLVVELTGEKYKGRGNGSKELDDARDFIQEQLKQAGLRPLLKDYCQGFTAPTDVKLACSLKTTPGQPDAKAVELEQDKDFTALGGSPEGRFKGELVFAGYGIRSAQRKHDSYAGVESLKGKIVVLFRYEPLDDKGQSLWASGGSARFTNDARFDAKAALAARLGAEAIVVVNPPSSGKDDPLTQNPAPYPRLALPVVHVTRGAMEGLLKQAGMDKTTLDDLQARADEGKEPLELGKTACELKLEWSVCHSDLSNLLCEIPGRGKLADEVVVVGAHYDHLGVRGGSVYPGADDNASGTAGLLLLGRRWAARTWAQGDAQAGPDRRTLILAAFSGEELGLFGSRHFVSNLDQLGKGRRVVAMLNLDMIGRLRNNRLLVEGTERHTQWRPLLERANTGGIKLVFSKPIPGATSDHASFLMKRIPAAFFCTGDHPDVHEPTDTADKINVPGALAILDLADRALEELLTAQELFAAPKTAVAATARRPSMGLRLSTAAQQGGGLKVQAVNAGSPADRAGVRPDDILIDANGTAINAISDFAAIAGKTRTGDVLRLTLRRGQEKLTLPVKLDND